MRDFHIESKVVRVSENDKKVFDFLSDFRNFDRFIPPEVEQWKSDSESCSFMAKGQQISLVLIEKEPNKTIKITSKTDSPVAFFIWIQLKATDDVNTAIKLTVEADLNVFLRGMLEKPVKQALDKIADKLSTLKY